MSQAWTWSLRAIRSLQILAEDWLELAKPQTRHSTCAELPASPSQQNPEDFESEVLEWLTDIENISRHPTRSLVLDLYSWPMGFFRFDPSSKG